MSNRQAEAKLEALKASHEAQIAALDPRITPGLTERERLERFAEAADIGEERMDYLHRRLAFARTPKAIFIAWWTPEVPKSLFANMPGCMCPVGEAQKGNLQGIPLIPEHITPDNLPRFAAVQQEAWAKYWGI